MPSNVTPIPKEFARRLLAHEAKLRANAEAKESAAVRVCEKMRGPLGKLMGVGGFRSLLSRALTVAGAEVPVVRTVHINGDGVLEGFDETNHDSHAIAQGEIALVAHLLGLLVTFIGAALTLRLLQDIWPEMDDLNFEREKLL